ncbi:hypothetical protein ACJX0J_042327, partial [Zea mays]
TRIKLPWWKPSLCDRRSRELGPGKNKPLSCKPTSGARRKGCYNPDEVLAFLRSVGFSANTTIYLTETWWHKGLNDLKEDFPNTYTKNKGEFLKSSNADLTRALDLEICSQSDVLIPA